MQQRRNESTAESLGRNKQVDGFLSGWAGIVAVNSDDVVERYLSESDPKLGILIAKIMALSGPRRYKPSNAASHFDAIARSIVYQQLSKQAAAAIYTRYISFFGCNPGPDQVMAATSETLRSAGLSAPKVRYLKALASAVTTGELDLERISELSDETIVHVLTKVPGVGVWTAQMFLMFRLLRLDILPTHDIGIQRGLQLAHGLHKPAAPGYVARAGQKWSPYRSIACLYLWASVDLGID